MTVFAYESEDGSDSDSDSDSGSGADEAMQKLSAHVKQADKHEYDSVAIPSGENCGETLAQLGHDITPVSFKDLDEIDELDAIVATP